MTDLTWYRPLHHLNLNRLLAFMAVAEMNSFRAAAERIHLSQSALSVQVRQLEEDLGVSLLHRTTRSVDLTDEGRALYAVIKRLSTDILDVTSVLKGQAALYHGVVSMIVLPSLAATLVPEIVAGFSTSHPGIRLHIRDADSKRAIEAIRNGDVDIGLLSQNEMLRELPFRPLLEDEFVALVPKNHPLSGRSRVKLKQVAEHPLLLNPKGVDLRETLEGLFRKEGAAPQIAQEIITSHALVSMVGSGLGVTILPRLALRGLNLSRCRILRIEPRAARRIGIVSARNRSDSPAVSALRGFLEANAARMASKSVSSTGIR